MPIDVIPPSSANRPYLKVGGTYGPGQEHEADCEVVDYEPLVEDGDGPGFDRECKRDSYCRFDFRIKHPEFGLINLREWQPKGENSGSKALTWIKALGVDVDPETGQYDTDDVVGRKCAIEVGDPSQDKKDPDKWWNGRVRNVFGLE